MAKKNYVYGGKGVAVMEWLNKEPNASDAHIAKYVGCHPTYVKQIRRKMVHAQQEEVGEYKPVPLRKKGLSDELGALLDERGSKYGPFLSHAMITQMLKNTTNIYLSKHDKTLMPDQQEALDMIFHKIGRIVNGDADHVDSWTDIAGYAKLVADRLQGVVR